MEKQTKTPAPKKAAKKRYWKNPIHFEAFGLIKGEVKRAHADEFNRISKETGSGSVLADWTTDRDLEAERKAESKRKMRAQLGFKDGE